MRKSVSYSDWLFAGDPDKYEQAALDVFGVASPDFGNYPKLQTEKFLRQFFDEPDLGLHEVTAEKDVSTGFTVYVFKYQTP